MNSAWPNERIDSAPSTPFSSLPMSSAQSLFGALFHSLYSNLNNTAKDTTNSTKDTPNSPVKSSFVSPNAAGQPSPFQYELSNAMGSSKGAVRMLSETEVALQLKSLPGIGPSLSDQIEASRRSSGTAGQGFCLGPSCSDPMNSPHPTTTAPNLGMLLSMNSSASASSASSVAHPEQVGTRQPQAGAAGSISNALSIERILGRPTGNEYNEGHSSNGGTAMERIEHTCRDGGAGGAVAAARHAAAVAAAGLGLPGLPMPLMGMPPMCIGIGSQVQTPLLGSAAAAVAAERANVALPVQMFPFAHFGPGGVVGPGGGGPLPGAAASMSSPQLMSALPLSLPMSMPMAMQMQMGLPMQMPMPFSMQVLAANHPGILKYHYFEWNFINHRWFIQYSQFHIHCRSLCYLRVLSLSLDAKMIYSNFKEAVVS